MHIIALNRTWVIRWRWMLVLFIVFVSLVGLCVWQLQRAFEKENLLQRLAQWQIKGALDPLVLQKLEVTDADTVQIAAFARWFKPGVWLLDNQTIDGRIGYDIIVPMQLIATQKIILVNLGWVAAPQDRNQLPQLNIPEDFYIQGILRTRLNNFRLGKNSEVHAGFPVRIQQIDITELGSQINQPLYAGVIYQLQNSPYRIHYQPVVMSPDRHRAYALQWGLLAFAVIVIGLSASVKTETDTAKESLNVRS